MYQLFNNEDDDSIYYFSSKFITRRFFFIKKKSYSEKQGQVYLLKDRVRSDSSTASVIAALAISTATCLKTYIHDLSLFPDTVTESPNCFNSAGGNLFSG